MQSSSIIQQKEPDTRLTWQEIDAAMVLLMLRYGSLPQFDLHKPLFGEESTNSENLYRRSVTKSPRTISNGSDFSTYRSSDSTTPDSIQTGGESLPDSGYVHKKYKRRCSSLDKVNEPAVKKMKETSTQTDENVLECEVTQENFEESGNEESESYSDDDQYVCSFGNNNKLRNNAAPAPRFVVRAGSSRGTNKDNIVINRKTFYTNLKSARDNDMISIGRGKVKVPAKALKKIKWTSYSLATRGLLEAVFSEEVLRTHSLTGKKSNAFPGKQPKSQLNPVLVNDIVLTVMELCRVPKNIVRLVITTTCSDKAKKKKENVDPEF